MPPVQRREASSPRAALSLALPPLLPDYFWQPGQVSAEDIQTPEKPEKSLEGQSGKDTSQNINTFNMEGARTVLGTFTCPNLNFLPSTGPRLRETGKHSLYT